MKKLNIIRQILKHKDFTTKIKIYFSTKIEGDDFDSYENNYTFTNLNYKTIKAYVTQLSPNSLVWKEYGLEEQGAKEIICEKRYKSWFELANKIEIEDVSYEVFKEAGGSRAMITDRPYNLIRIVLRRR